MTTRLRDVPAKTDPAIPGAPRASVRIDTESTCVTVLQAVLMLTPALLQRTLVVVGYPQLADAAEHCAEIIEHWRPIGLEALDSELIEEQAAQHMHLSDLRELPADESRAWLLVQFGADTEEESTGRAHEFAQWLTKEKGYAADRIRVVKSAQEGGQSQDIWEIREGGLGSTAFARGEDNRLAALVPELVNVVTQTPGLRRLAKLAAGIDKRRPLPAFAPMTLQQWFRQRGGTANPAGRAVVLFPDTFNNYLHANVGVACVEALEAAGWRVIMPERHVCCGRPLYDYGFLDSAERYLRRVLDELRPYVRDDIPVVGMEPSCLAVFKDELHRMLPHDDDAAARLAGNSYHFGEFFTAFGVRPPRIGGSALLWGHCHHRATGGMTPEKEILQQRACPFRS